MRVGLLRARQLLRREGLRSQRAGRPGDGRLPVELGRPPSRRCFPAAGVSRVAAAAMWAASLTHGCGVRGIPIHQRCRMPRRRRLRVCGRLRDSSSQRRHMPLLGRLRVGRRCPPGATARKVKKEWRW